MNIQKEKFNAHIMAVYGEHVLWNGDKPTDIRYADLWITWQQAQKQAIPDRHIVVNKGDYVELVKTNRERQVVIARLTEEVKIIRDRKKHYKNKCKEQAIPEGFVLVEKDLIQSIYQSCVNCLDVDVPPIFRATVNTIRDEVKPLIEAQEQNDA